MRVQVGSVMNALLAMDTATPAVRDVFGFVRAHLAVRNVLTPLPFEQCHGQRDVADVCVSVVSAGGRSLSEGLLLRGPLVVRSPCHRVSHVSLLCVERRTMHDARTWLGISP